MNHTPLVGREQELAVLTGLVRRSGQGGAPLVFVHGEAEFLTSANADFDAIEQHLVGHYGSSPSSWGDEIVYIRVQPTWMIGYAFEPTTLLAGLESGSD